MLPGRPSPSCPPAAGYSRDCRKFWVPGLSDGLATRSSERPQSSEPGEPHHGLQAWQKPRDEASQGRDALLPNGKVRSSACPYTLLLRLFSPFQFEGHPAHPTCPSPSHLFYWLWSHQMPPWAKQLINVTHATHFCSSKNAKSSYLFQQQPNPPFSPVQPSMCPALSSFSTLIQQKTIPPPVGFVSCWPHAGPFDRAKTTKYGCQGRDTSFADELGAALRRHLVLIKIIFFLSVFLPRLKKRFEHNRTLE